MCDRCNAPDSTTLRVLRIAESLNINPQKFDRFGACAYCGVCSIRSQVLNLMEAELEAGGGPVTESLRKGPQKNLGLVVGIQWQKTNVHVDKWLV